MDYLLLKISKLPWYIRYPVAVCTLYASWWMFNESNLTFERDCREAARVSPST